LAKEILSNRKINELFIESEKSNLLIDLLNNIDFSNLEILSI
jgi:hypothetical protein